MKIELRADGVHIDGYVNVTGKHSRPVVTPRGKVIEVIEPRAFEEAIAKSGNVTVELDHDSGHVYASTRDNTLTLKEDAIGLHADVVITDEHIIELARKGRLRGWSFGMYKVEDEMESRAEGELPIRHVKGLLLDHISLIANKVPCYAATSVEVRAEAEVDMEERALGSEVVLIDNTSEPKPDLSLYEYRVRALDLEDRGNPNHDPKTGRLTSGAG